MKEAMARGYADLTAETGLLQRIGHGAGGAGGVAAVAALAARFTATVAATLASAPTAAAPTALRLLARLVVEDRLPMDEAAETIADLSYHLPRRVFRLDGARSDDLPRAEG